METLNESKLISIIREEYANRLTAISQAVKLVEVKVWNERGDLLLSKGLKVRHKSSGYEYTIDRVEGEGESAVVFLRHPEIPRFQPPISSDPLTEQEEVDAEPAAAPIMPQESEEQIGLLRVSLEDFEKEYEVD